MTTLIKISMKQVIKMARAYYFDRYDKWTFGNWSSSMRMAWQCCKRMAAEAARKLGQIAVFTKKELLKAASQTGSYTYSRVDNSGCASDYNRGVGAYLGD